MGFDFLVADARFVALLMLITPLVTSAISDHVPGDWTTRNKPTIAALIGAALSAVYWFALDRGLMMGMINHTLLEYAISGTLAGLASSGVMGIKKDVQDGSITNTTKG